MTSAKQNRLDYGRKPNFLSLHFVDKSIFEQSYYMLKLILRECLASKK